MDDKKVIVILVIVIVILIGMISFVMLNSYKEVDSNYVYAPVPNEKVKFLEHILVLMVVFII